LEAVHLWNLPGIEQEEEKPHFWEKAKEPKETDRKEKFKRVFEREKASCREWLYCARLADLALGTCKGAILAGHIRATSQGQTSLLR
jgi:hypothetical protein